MSAYDMMGNATTFMTMDMRQKLGSYYYSLQDRYGDPAVYAAERELVKQQEEEIAHAQATSQAQALEKSYHTNRAEIRAQHHAKHGRRAQGNNPQ